MLNIDDRLIKEVSPKIRPNALSVLLAIAIHLNQKTNRCFPSHERLMSLTGLGKNTVYDALNVLKENGLLVSEQKVDSKTRKFEKRTFRLSTRFIKIFVDAQDVEPLPEFPYTGKPLPESWEPENRFPKNREPENRETELINNKEQINSLSDSQAKSDRAPETQTVASIEKETGATADNTANSPTPQSPPPQIGYTFEQFWNDYAHKVGSKVKCEKAFVKLTATEREQIRATLPAYKRETVTNDKGREKDCFKPMRQHPLTYLNGRMWVTYSERTAKEEVPTPFDEAYNVYLEWVSSNFPQAYQSAAYFSKSQFIEFKTGSKAQIIGRESERDFVKKAHERAPLEAKDAYSIYQHLLSHRLSIRTV